MGERTEKAAGTAGALVLYHGAGWGLAETLPGSFWPYHNDAMDYASIGRNMPGAGDLAYLTPGAEYPSPSTTQPVGARRPLILGGVQYFLPASDGVIAWATGFFYLAVGAALYWPGNYLVLGWLWLPPSCIYLAR